MSDFLPQPGFEPDDLDGHTLDELSDYLERGRQPFDESIEGSPACQIALDSLERLRDLADSFLDGTGQEDPDRDWVSAVMESIPLDARSGRSFPVPSDHPELVASVTEGALRGLVRALGDAVPGLLVGGVRFTPDGGASLEVDVALIHGFPLVVAVHRLRRELTEALPEHVPFAVDRIDIRVVALIASPGASA